MFGDIFKKYFNFQGFYIVYIIIWWFLGWKKFTPSKLGETGHQKLQNDESFFRENPLKIAHGLNFAPKIIPAKKPPEKGRDKKQSPEDQHALYAPTTDNFRGEF